MKNLVHVVKREDSITATYGAEKPQVVVETEPQQGSVETGMLQGSVAFEMRLKYAESEQI